MFNKQALIDQVYSIENRTLLNYWKKNMASSKVNNPTWNFVVRICFALLLAEVLYRPTAAAATEENTAIITLYEHTDFKGNSRKIYLRGTECFPLFGAWSDQVSSIDLDQGVCVKLYKSRTCNTREGYKTVIGIGKDSGTRQDAGKNLYYNAFNDAANGIALCN